jgi:hypothetical protein
MWTRLRAENPHLAKLIQLFNPNGIKTTRDVVREGFLKSIWPTLLNLYCAPTTAAEWTALLSLAQPLVNSHLAQQLPTYSATACLEMDTGRQFLKIADGELEVLPSPNGESDLTLKLDNANWQNLLIALTAEPGEALAHARTAGSQQALDDFAGYLRAFQTYLRPWCKCGTPVETVQ